MSLRDSLPLRQLNPIDATEMQVKIPLVPKLERSERSNAVCPQGGDGSRPSGPDHQQ
ncbi:hypothetical protein CfE428DRAFT_4203 [Chthoniobacter flavus Ellin428]|uniref:Uncharacterized protein n=1 Tax=Chthoniobacter flavus Ellin428 TaxID=497964 RepID=B4D5L4_9BACT|nr:hypothetical protein CfE428DRAFT_4203 [Chthoniobacter flavus Ellin428]TCO90872.1 hypothetical protein EV701_10921 [Chthoniobacter flavus]